MTVEENPMKNIIDALRRAKIKVTIYDNGTDKVDFVLAVMIVDPIDIWYVANVIGRAGVVPYIDGRHLFFPALRIDSDTYDYICAED
jgi:hypothetical protein